MFPQYHQLPLEASLTVFTQMVNSVYSAPFGQRREIDIIQSCLFKMGVFSQQNFARRGFIQQAPHPGKALAEFALAQQN